MNRFLSSFAQPKLWLVAVLLALGLSACEDAIIETPPEERARQFFDALYNQRDVNEAARLSSENYRELILYYGNATTIGRYLYNMSYERVEITAGRSNTPLYQDRTDSARIIVTFNGIHNGRRVQDLREVVMVREQGSWRMDRMLDGTPVSPDD